MTTQRALLALLVSLFLGAPASAQEVISISGIVTTSADGAPVAGAVISVSGTDATATTDGSGQYTLVLPRAAVHGPRIQARVDALGLATQTFDVVIDGATLAANFELALGFTEHVTVGSRASSAESEKAVPVDIITREQIARSGYTETAQVIQSLTPSFNFPRPTITDGTDTVRPATLRGLGPDQVLVLVNGKRRHQSALVHLNNSIGRGSTGADLNAIPLSAIDYIEVLRDGAAAQYGSDAIAGVINVVMKSGPSPPTVTSKFGLSMGSFPGNTCTPDGLSCDTGDDIDFSDGGLFDAGGSWGLAAGKGQVTISAEYRHHNRTNRASFDPRDQIVAGDAAANAVPQPNHRWGDPDARDVMTFVDASVPINSRQTAVVYGFGGYSRRTANSAGFFRRSLDPRNWPQIYPRGFLPVIEPAVVDAAGAVGIRGVYRRWNYDASGEFGQNSFDFAVDDSLNVSLGPLAPADKTRFDAGRLELSQFVANLDVSRAFRVGRLSGPVNVAMGAEYRHENYRIHAGEPDSYDDGGVPNQFGGRAAIGAQVFPGFRPSNETDESRHSVAGYVDVEGDVLARLRLGAAARAEHYSDFGGTVDGKFTTRLKIDPRLVLRGSVSTGFRAPSLGQSFFSSTATNFLNLGQGLVPVESLTLPVDSGPAQVLGAQALKPEQSLNMSAGMVITPVSDLTVTVDGYRIAIDDRIVLSGNFTAAPIVELLAPFGANSARFFTNAIDTRTNGIDITVNHQMALGGSGQLQMYAGYNNTLTELVGAIATPPQLAQFASVLFDRIEQRRLECGQPRDSVRLGGDWERSSFGVMVNAARFGEFCSFTLNPADDQEFSPKWVTDVQVSYRTSGYLLAVGAQNLFDVFPDRNTTVNSFNGIQTFPSHSPFGMNGRVLYGRIGRTF